MAVNYSDIKKHGLAALTARYGKDAVEHAVRMTERFSVEVPGWQFWEGFGGGGRFEDGGSGGAARTTREIAEDAGLVHRLTGSTPLVGMHVLWFLSEDGETGNYETARTVRDELEAEGVLMGSISPTYFLAGSWDGSLSARDNATRERYIDQTVFAARVAAELSNGLVTLWFPDGTNYPGQRDLQEKITLLNEGLAAFWEKVTPDVRDGLDKILVEYKVFEPGTYSTTVPDWGTSRELSRRFGHWGGVLVDMGHHHHGTNIEQIVANLIAFDVPCGFHFNTRYAADDDHSVQADYELARLFYELMHGNVLFNDTPGKNWNYALDQMARTEQRIPSVLKSVDALKQSVAKAALVDSDGLRNAQDTNDILAANRAFENALLGADVRPIVMESYERLGLHPVPIDAYRESATQQHLEQERR